MEISVIGSCFDQFIRQDIIAALLEGENRLNDEAKSQRAKGHGQSQATF